MWFFWLLSSRGPLCLGDCIFFFFSKSRLSHVLQNLEVNKCFTSYLLQAWCLACVWVLPKPLQKGQCDHLSLTKPFTDKNLTGRFTTQWREDKKCSTRFITLQFILFYLKIRAMAGEKRWDKDVSCNLAHHDQGILHSCVILFGNTYINTVTKDRGSFYPHILLQFNQKVCFSLTSWVL